MDKDISNHKAYVENRIRVFEQKLKESDSNPKTELLTEDIKRLYDFHQRTVQDFQHERLIHLMVTFFFAGLLLLSIIATFLFAIFPATYNYTLINILILIICAFLFITEIFYVRHYYRLENGTQSLYKLSKKLYELSLFKD